MRNFDFQARRNQARAGMVEWKGISGYSDFPEFEADLALFYSIPNPESAQGKRFLLLKYNCLWKLMF